MALIQLKTYDMIPVRTNVLFKPFPSDEVSTGGIYVPENARDINNKGIVVKVGNGTKEKPMKLKEGQIGFRVKDWGEPIIIEGELHFIMDQDAIIGVQ